ncbi:MAG: stage sporulation protein [Haloplasmataceae bacterium]|jgi:stage V sporulation protein K|nr:stage sporulation protein [Haloplasmataceae bacterium]
MKDITNTYEYLLFKEKYFKDIIGLDNVIKEIFAIYALTQVNEIKKKRNIEYKKQALNMIFYGNPGTGKTTVARLVAKMFSDIKYLEKGHLIEIDRSDLIGEYIGQTTIKTKKILEEAKGGILFIDEAYSLYNEDYTDFGNEAIDIILKFVEDHHEDIIVIFAGYKEKIDVMLNNNKGLNSRFPIKLFFEDYNLNELKQIFSYTIKLNGFDSTKELQKKFNNYLNDLVNRNNPILKHNGRFVRNLVEDIIRKHDMRVFLEKAYNENLMILSEEDFM